MEFIYFGESDKRLFGVYHQPKGNLKKNIGVILCHPMGQEHIRCYRLAFKLANEIADLGCHVLRFDFNGYGDSYGNLEDATLSGWLDDLTIAIEELKYGCDIGQIYLIGIRFGATLILKLSETVKIDGSILWNPVLDGRKYVDEISKEHKKWLTGSFAKQRVKSKSQLEYLGFPFSKRLISDIKELNLQQERLLHQCNYLVIDENKNIVQLIKNNEDLIEHIEPINKKFWVKLDGEDTKSLIPQQEISVIKDWLGKLNE